jgi:hypothetical protein
VGFAGACAFGCELARAGGKAGLWLSARPTASAPGQCSVDKLLLPDHQACHRCLHSGARCRVAAGLRGVRAGRRSVCRYACLPANLVDSSCGGSGSAGIQQAGSGAGVPLRVCRRGRRRQHMCIRLSPGCGVAPRSALLGPPAPRALAPIRLSGGERYLLAAVLLIVEDLGCAHGSALGSSPPGGMSEQTRWRGRTLPPTAAVPSYPYY